ncbi:MAG: GNAT family N-acetyltransferase [Planctomycetota bacterium]|nr:GNAT family N-acetyltransferase [Planctomycetota bacterium]
MSVALPPVTVRRFQSGDSAAEITRLLHRAYANQMLMGLRPWAGRQDEATTLERARNSESYVATIPALDHSGAVVGEKIVGVILFNEVEQATFPAFFLRPDVAHFSQFGVDPDHQGLGVGGKLLAKVESRARESGASQLALSMAEPDTKLREYYEKRGYAFVEHWQWPYTNYRSVLLSKPMR